MTTLALFIQSAQDQPLFFASVLFTVVLSITLHELAHGWMAIRLGDDTPRRLDRMTINPIVHMGLWSIIALLLMGIAWGSMPIDRSRLRGRYAQAKVAFAGPEVNLILAMIVLTALGIGARYEPRLLFEPTMDDHVWSNTGLFLRVFGFTNLLLFVFNLLPLPPLDGSHILANLNRGYDNFISDPSNGGALMIMFCFAFIVAQSIFDPINQAAWWYLRTLAS